MIEYEFDAGPVQVQPGRVPRVSRLLALAIEMEELVATGRVRDYAELARLVACPGRGFPRCSICSVWRRISRRRFFSCRRLSPARSGWGARFEGSVRRAGVGEAEGAPIAVMQSALAARSGIGRLPRR